MQKMFMQGPRVDEKVREKREFREEKPKADVLERIPKRIEEPKTQGIFCRFSSNIKKAVVVVTTAVMIALPFVRTAQAAEIPKTDISVFVEEEKAEEEQKPRERPEMTTAEADTYECSLTGVRMLYWEDPYTLPPDTTYYDDIPFAYQDSSGTLIDQYAFEDTTGPSHYPAFFVEEIIPPNPDGVPDRYEVLFRYIHKTLTEIGEEMDSITAYEGVPVTMEIIINDSTSMEWLRATIVEWEDMFPRCRGPPDYYWVDITPENPSRTFDDDFLFLSVFFSSDNPLDSGFDYFVNLNYIRDLVSSVGISEQKDKDKINGALRPYPNPTNNNFSLTLDNKYETTNLKIYDNNGRLIKEINKDLGFIYK